MCQKFCDALAAWNTGRYVSMRQCAEAFGVPRTSLNDMIREGRTEWRVGGRGGRAIRPSPRPSPQPRLWPRPQTRPRRPGGREPRPLSPPPQQQQQQLSRISQGQTVKKRNLNLLSSQTPMRRKTVEQKIAVRGQRDKVEASSKQLEEQKKGIKIKQEMLSSSSVPSASDTSTHNTHRRHLQQIQEEERDHGS